MVSGLDMARATVRQGRGVAEVESGADRALRGGIGVQWVGQSGRAGRTVRSLWAVAGPACWLGCAEERGWRPVLLRQGEREVGWLGLEGKGRVPSLFILCMYIYIYNSKTNFKHIIQTKNSYAPA